MAFVTIVIGAYKQTYNWGAPLCMDLLKEPPKNKLQHIPYTMHSPSIGFPMEKMISIFSKSK